LIRTNMSVAPDYTKLPVAVDFEYETADAWTYETVDLTPWAGQTIQVVFYYQGTGLFSPIKGWLIDDISITGVAAGGNITITKNLGQGIWTLSQASLLGATPIQSGTAPSVAFTNLPVGDYIVQFGDVPYYQTPPAQTNTLAPGGALNFTGNYGFADLNTNGMSDAWERDNFGGVSPDRAAQTDTDGDGMSDYAEFIAGTNPLNPASRLYFTGEWLSDDRRQVQIQWTSVTNRLYQVNVSTNLQTWTPASGWLQATNGNTMTFNATNTSAAQFFRVEVRP